MGRPTFLLQKQKPIELFLSSQGSSHLGRSSLEEGRARTLLVDYQPDFFVDLGQN